MCLGPPVSFNPNSNQSSSNHGSYHQADVLLGKKHCQHEGNVYYRALIAQFLPWYNQGVGRKEKTMIIRRVNELIRQRGGNFLKEDNDGYWYPVFPSEAHEKTSNAFRDATLARSCKNKLPKRRSKSTAANRSEKGQDSTRKPNPSTLEQPTNKEANLQTNDGLGILPVLHLPTTTPYIHKATSNQPSPQHEIDGQHQADQELSSSDVDKLLHDALEDLQLNHSLLLDHHTRSSTSASNRNGAQDDASCSSFGDLDELLNISLEDLALICSFLVDDDKASNTSASDHHGGAQDGSCSTRAEDPQLLHLDDTTRAYLSSMDMSIFQ